MAWDGVDWGSGGAIQRQKDAYSLSPKKAGDKIRLASVYYSAANAALVDMKHGRLWMLPAWVWCLTLAVHYVQSYPRDEQLTPDECDVALCVLRRYANPLSPEVARHKRHLLTVYQKASTHTDVCKPHTMAFMHMHKLHILDGGKMSDADEQVLNMLLDRVQKAGNYAQAARVAKQVATLCPRGSEKRLHYRQVALESAQKADATDQVRKISAGL